MKKGQKVASRMFELGLNPVPVVVGSKEPARKKHNTAIPKEDILKYSFDEIGISTGLVSGGLEVLDFDLKNSDDPEGTMEAFRKNLPQSLLDKLVIQQTQSGGYHYIYRCSDITSSKKIAKNETGEAVIETRGEGGYIKCFPSEGYTMVQGSFSEIPNIKPHERNQLWISAKFLNKQLLKDASRRVSTEDREYLKKFPEYNSDPEIGMEILINSGWKEHSRTDDGEWVNFTRPNSTSGDIHGGYNLIGNFFFVFSTAQDIFETEKPYNNHAIFAEVVHKGRYDIAYAKLHEKGHGVDDSEIEEDYVDPIDFLSDEVEENTYLDQSRKGEIAQGLLTGWRGLDDYFRFKPNSVNVGLGFDNVGKSVLITSLMAASKAIHGWKWGIAAPENKTAVTRKRLIEAESGKLIETFKDSPMLFDKYKQDARENYKIIANKKHYTIKEILDKGRILYERYGIDAFLIDPYNFFAVEGDAYGNDNKILSMLRVFAEKYCSVYVMAHPYTEATRKNTDEYGYLTAPNKYQIQGGNNFANRVDDFFIAHRIVNHTDRDIRRTVQFIVEKVKERETGGQVHPKGEFTSLMYEERHGFLGYWDVNGDNPMYKVIQNRKKLGGMKKMSPEEAF